MLNLDPRLYATPQAFVDERERVFSKTWQLVGPASQVGEPGSYAAIEIAGLGLCAARA
jgi:choline monooxygenase